MIGLRVFSAISALKIVVDVGLVTGRDAADHADRFGDLGDAVDLVAADHADGLEVLQASG